MTNRAAQSFVEANLKYLASREAPVHYVASQGGGDTSLHQGHYVMQSVAIADGRNREQGFSLDREGFLLTQAATDVMDFYDKDQIVSTYEPEVKGLIRGATGANRVEVFDHTLRTASTDLQRARSIREPASIVHNDYTARSAPIRLKDHFADRPEEAEDLLKRRFAIVNLWRSIGGTVQSAPLALCDASSVAPEDLISVQREAKDRIGEIQQAVYSPTHRWFTFPQMTMAEALLIKTYDSDAERARFTIHTAFEDPAAPPDAPPRESIETRCFAFF